MSALAILRALRQGRLGVSIHIGLVVFVALYGAIVLVQPNYLEPGLAMNFLRRAAPLAILAVGALYVILTGGLDLSVGSTVTLVVLAASILINGDPTRTWPVILLLYGMGLAIGISVTVRLPGVFVIPVFAIWLAVVVPVSGQKRLALILGFMGAVVLPIDGYARWHEHVTGRFALTNNGVINFYGRVAPWADCSKFTPPAGTHFLCETTPVHDRPGHDVYLFVASPMQARFALRDLTTAVPPEGAKQLKAWSEAAVLGQPFTYLHAVFNESRRIIRPSAAPGIDGQSRDGFGLSPGSYFHMLTWPDRDSYVLYTLTGHYPHTTQINKGHVGWFKDYETVARPFPLLMALALALALLAPFLTRGPERRAAWLFTPTALLLLEMPIVTSTYDYRYIFPAFGFLFAAAALGGWAVAIATRGACRARNRPGGPRPARRQSRSSAP